MLYMFYQAYAFNQPLSLDTSSVSSMGNMFQYAYAFNQPLSLDISSVTYMYYMFQNTNALSAANKLLIRCAWAGNTEFDSRYGNSWNSYGACSPPPRCYIEGALNTVCPAGTEIDPAPNGNTATSGDCYDYFASVGNAGPVTPPPSLCLPLPAAGIL